MYLHALQRWSEISSIRSGLRSFFYGTGVHCLEGMIPKYVVHADFVGFRQRHQHGERGICGAAFKAPDVAIVKAGHFRGQLDRQPAFDAQRPKARAEPLLLALDRPHGRATAPYLRTPVNPMKRGLRKPRRGGHPTRVMRILCSATDLVR
jgi:hypothetical protein